MGWQPEATPVASTHFDHALLPPSSGATLWLITDEEAQGSTVADTLGQPRYHACATPTLLTGDDETAMNSLERQCAPSVRAKRESHVGTAQGERLHHRDSVGRGRRRLRQRRQGSRLGSTRR